MSRKRTLKKLQKRQESARERLEELYLRGADDEFLALADEEIKNPASSLLAAEWAEVARRVLRQGLARADLGRLERLLPSLRRGGPLLPELALAEAVLDLTAGRLEAARSRLAALAEGETAPFSQDLLAALQSLAQDGMESLPGEEPYLQAARELFDALRSLDRQALARSAEALRAAAPAEAGEIHRLLDSAGRCLSLLADLDALDEKLGSLAESDRSSTSQLVASWLRGPGPLLAATLTTAGPALLAPLQHSVRLRWRAVLERVAAREGAPGLAVLCAADPRLFAGDMNLPGGIQAGLASLRQGAQVRQLLATRQYRELAGVLHARSQAEPDSGALAALWSLELWAMHRRNADDADEDNWFAEPAEPPARHVLVRLRTMAGEIGRRFPAEQRAEVARSLRDKLLDLCEQVPLGEPVARAALSLLEHQPGDLGLLIAGVAGAVADGDAKTLRALRDRFPHGKVQEVQEDSLAIARRTMVQVAREAPPTVAQSLDLLRPLFAESVWPQIVTLVARTMSRSFALVLSEALFESAMEGRRVGDRPFTEIRRQLDRLRPPLAGTPGFAAMELAFEYLQPGPIAEKRLQKFMADNPGLEGVLTAFRLLESSAPPFFRMPERGRRARNKLAREVIERLDEHWELWEPAMKGLIIFAGEGHLPRLAEKIQQVLASPEFPPAGRQPVEQALQTVLRMLKPRPSRIVRKPRRRRSETPQLRLEI
jgi:hypothetical protein